jgi:hypothetical protein
MTNCHPLRVGARATAYDGARVKTTVDVIVVEISDGDSRGRGEGVPAPARPDPKLRADPVDIRP